MTVEAAGGVVVRTTATGTTEVLLVHRPRYDDWSLPKGKCDPGERHETCALREVEEETGLRCALEDELVTTSYVDRKGRPKVVRYWRMHPVGGDFVTNDEVDELRWLPVAEARSLLSYERDQAVLDACERSLEPS